MIMSATCTKEKTIQNNYIEQRMEEVDTIRKAHSEKLFGYSHASIKEIRNEAVRTRFESIYNA